MGNCRRCGANNPDRARFCHSCGTAMAKDSRVFSLLVRVLTAITIGMAAVWVVAIFYQALNSRSDDAAYLLNLPPGPGEPVSAVVSFRTAPKNPDRSLDLGLQIEEVEKTWGLQVDYTGKGEPPIYYFKDRPHFYYSEFPNRFPGQRSLNFCRYYVSSGRIVSMDTNVPEVAIGGVTVHNSLRKVVKRFGRPKEAWMSEESGSRLFLLRWDTTNGELRVVFEGPDKGPWPAKVKRIAVHDGSVDYVLQDYLWSEEEILSEANKLW